MYSRCNYQHCMRKAAHLLLIATLVLPVRASTGQNAQPSKVSPRILSAKSVYFDDQMGDAAVSREAFAQLKKWGRFKIAKDPKEADLVFLLSADPRKGGYVVFSGGQTGTVDKKGDIQEDPVPTFNKQSPIRYAYLTVYDAKSGDELWRAEHQWGGALTGFHSAGARLIKKLQRQVEK